MKRYSPSHLFQREHKDDIQAYLAQFAWQWFAHLSIKPEFSIWKAKYIFKKWRYAIIDRERLKVGAIRITGWKRKHPHFHVLMLGSNRYGKTLSSCDPSYYEKAWNGGTADIRVIDSVNAAAGYGSIQFMPWHNSYAELDYYGVNLLEDEMRYPNPPYNFIGAVQ